MTKYILMALIFLLITPLAVSLVDGLCWFYLDTVCTGIAYSAAKVGFTGIMAVVAGLLALLLSLDY